MSGLPLTDASRPRKFVRPDRREFTPKDPVRNGILYCISIQVCLGGRHYGCLTAQVLLMSRSGAAEPVADRFVEYLQDAAGKLPDRPHSSASRRPS